MEFTPEEMAYEAPADVSDPKRFPTLARGRAEWQQFLSLKRGYVRIDADLRKFFKDDRSVNQVLRQAMGLMKLNPAHGRKSA